MCWQEVPHRQKRPWRCGTSVTVSKCIAGVMLTNAVSLFVSYSVMFAESFSTEKFNVSFSSYVSFLGKGVQYTCREQSRAIDKGVEGAI